MANVKVLSLRQPWAYLLASGAKKYETRPWQPRQLRSGELYIHASEKIDFDDLELCRLSGHFKKYIPDHTNGILVQGAIIGKVNLVEIVSTESVRDSLSDEERAFGDYRDGRWAWKCEGAMLLPEPIKVKGKLSLWDYDMDNDKEIHEYEPDLMGRDANEIAEEMWNCQRNVK
jgi:hypothetical protein